MEELEGNLFFINVANSSILVQKLLLLWNGIQRFIVISLYFKYYAATFKEQSNIGGGLIV